MANSSKKTYYGIAAVVGIAVIFLLIRFIPIWSARSNVLSQCGPGMDCVCFKNVVENRLTNQDIRVFNKFLGAIRMRQNANILEFTDELSAQRISKAISICRVGSGQEETITNNKKGK